MCVSYVACSFATISLEECFTFNILTLIHEWHFTLQEVSFKCRTAINRCIEMSWRAGEEGLLKHRKKCLLLCVSFLILRWFYLDIFQCSVLRVLHQGDVLSLKMRSSVLYSVSWWPVYTNLKGQQKTIPELFWAKGKNYQFSLVEHIWPSNEVKS